ncbi:hypothetical protein CBS12448_3176 [Aspergillus niger]|nr:hypothetical protein CBS133816_3477 [Aspergillus niger]KAI2864151.1 hypothetical protein CBS12448_3176 [Aspergillus niger]KAI3022325.1 hypothetical protein CBS147482_1687 [Aspergillus niger]
MMALDRSNIRLMTSTAWVKSWLWDQSDKELICSSSLHGRFNFQLLLLLRISRNAPDPECSTDSSYPESGSRHIQCSIDTRTVHPLTQDSPTIFRR